MTAITSTLVAAADAFITAGKSPWATLSYGGADVVEGVFVNRDAARSSKSGRPVKYADIAGSLAIDDMKAEVFTPEELVEVALEGETNSTATDGDEFASDKADLPADLAPTVTPVPPVVKDPVAKADKPAVEVRHASEVVRPTKMVWAIADEMKASNPEVSRKEVLAECDRRGIAFFTARTQYQVWKSMQANA